MSIAFRVDASFQIGTGHVMRCLTLANELRDRNKDVYFICRDLKGNLSNYIEKKGFYCKLLSNSHDELLVDEDSLSHAQWLGVSWQKDAEDTNQILCNNKVEWLVVDHYGIDSRWHKLVRKNIGNLFVIDDLADRKLDCDILLDQNFYLNPEQRYSHLVNERCSCLLGPKHALLRKEFIQQKQIKRCDQRKSVVRIFVFMGGSDPTNETEKALLGLDKVKDINFEVDVVVSSANPRANYIEEMCANRCFCKFHKDVMNISQLMNEADMAIGAGGATTLERCYLGLPSLVIMVAENQKETTKALNKVGALHCIGWYSDISSDDIYRAVNDFIYHPEKLEQICIKANQVLGKNNYYGVNGVVSEMLGME
ncbi:MAG: UDP-2,4-diacetamido-2,4,6-trideoxy-beta-L-altropyranose hydrolase [Gammaproteobacteria bacterium]|nr:UDP-2,4-diacetamido-2,4,6-trideoxy-beta-L-altropyranose hydrolase [Gammaproteobacteria bacterium]